MHLTLRSLKHQTGFLPDCRMSLDKGYTQGVRQIDSCLTLIVACSSFGLCQGSNADSLLSDSFVKGISHKINWEDGLAAMLKDATVTPPDWTYEGRGGIVNRAKLGYVPVCLFQRFLRLSKSRLIDHHLEDRR